MGVPRLEGLPDREETIAHYEAKLARKVSNLEYYDLLATFRMAIVGMRAVDRQIERGTIAATSNARSHQPIMCLLAKRMGEPEPTPGEDYAAFAKVIGLAGFFWLERFVQAKQRALEAPVFLSVFSVQSAPRNEVRRWQQCRCASFPQRTLSRAWNCNSALDTEFLQQRRPQIILADLGGGHRPLGDETHIAGYLEAGETVLAELDDFRLGDAGPRAQLDECGGHFLELLIGHPDHRRQFDRRVGGEERLDLHRSDVLAADLESVLEAAVEVDIAALVHGAEVAGVEPVVLVEGGGGFFRIVPVAGDHVVALHPQQPALARGYRPAGFGVANLGLEALHGQAAGAAADRLVIAVEWHHWHAGALGDPIAGQDAGIRQRFFHQHQGFRR